MHYLRYLRYILKHKWNVFIECWKAGLYWHGITHDLSKFKPSEFFPYAKYFNFDRSNILDGDDLKRVEEHKKIKDAFFEAVELHYKRNKHHWNHWTYWGQDGDPMYCPPIKQFANPMPEKYIKQMICDWKAMDRGLKQSSAVDYYTDCKHTMILNKRTIKIVEKLLGI